MKTIKIQELKFDRKNPNKHTEKGMRLLEKSLQKLGCGRSIVLDRENRIICGNGVVEVAGQIGLEDVIVVETTGRELVAVKRKDLSLDEEKGRELSIVDNQVALQNISFDFELLEAESQELGIKLEEWEFEPLPFEVKKDFKYKGEEVGQNLNKIRYELKSRYKVKRGEFYRIDESFLYCWEVWDVNQWKNLVPSGDICFVPFGSLFILLVKERVFVVNPSEYMCGLMLTKASEVGKTIEKV